MTTRRLLVTAVAALVLVPLAVVSARRSRDERALAQLDRALAPPRTRSARRRGARVFRFDTFGDEAFWGDTLRLHEAIEGEALGGVGDGVRPRTALALGLKVDVDALPRSLRGQLRRGEVDLDDPATTLALLGLDAVVGVTGFFEGDGLASVGIQCALCHSTVDDSLRARHRPPARRLGEPRPRRRRRSSPSPPNLSRSPTCSACPRTRRAVRAAELGAGEVRRGAHPRRQGRSGPTGKTAATLIPPAFGLAGVNLHTWTGWGSVPYWNAFVANLEMHGQGTFFDPRLDDAVQFPIAARTGFGARARTRRT